MPPGNVWSTPCVKHAHPIAYEFVVEAAILFLVDPRPKPRKNPGQNPGRPKQKTHTLSHMICCSMLSGNFWSTPGAKIPGKIPDNQYRKRTPYRIIKLERCRFGFFGRPSVQKSRAKIRTTNTEIGRPIAYEFLVDAVEEFWSTPGAKIPGKIPSKIWDDQYKKCKNFNI